MSIATIWAQLTLKYKQIAVFMFIIAVETAISLSAYFTAYRELDEFQNTLKSYYTINLFLQELRANYDNLGRFMRDGNMDSLRTYTSSRDELIVLLARTDRESNVSLQTYHLINALTNALGVYNEKGLQAVVDRQTDQKESYLPFYAAGRIREYLEGYVVDMVNVKLAEGRWYYDRLAGRVEIARLVTLSALLVILVLTVRFAFAFSKYLSEPIRLLAKAAERISHGDLEVAPITVSTRDEIGALAAGFNLMSESIRHMVADLKVKSQLELEKESMLRSLREAQLTSLQTQINPHFLFNTLNIIGRTALFEHASDTAGLISSLANILRYNLIGHKRTAPLSQEVATVSEYLRLQQKRFGDRLNFSIVSAPEAEAVTVPPLILQPFVENSLIYGIEPKESGGMVKVRTALRNGRLRIAVLDTGAGMEREKLMEVRAAYGRPVAISEDIHGTGVANVAGRLALLYGECHRFVIYSRSGIGTLVAISIPVNAR